MSECKIYGPFTINDFMVGDRVEIQPWLDLWMQGARYGKVIGVKSSVLHIRLDVLPDKFIICGVDHLFARWESKRSEIDGNDAVSS